jgi:drug/metabolite transporter (DMT)-like permease
LDGWEGGSKFKIPNPKSKIQNPKSKIQNSKFLIQNPKSKIQNPKSKIPLLLFLSSFMQLHQTSGRWQYGFALAFLTAVLWGVLPIALKVVLTTVDVYTVTWFRFFLSFVVLALQLKQQGTVLSLPKLGRSRLDLLAIAILFLAANYWGYLKGLDETSPTNAQVLIQLAQVLMSLGGLWIFKESYSRQQWLSLAVLLGGLGLFFREQLHLLANASAQYLVGSSFILFGAVTWAVYALAQKQLLRQLSSQVIMLLIYGSCTLIFTPLAQPHLLLVLTPVQWIMLLFAGFNTFLAYGAFAEALEHLEASRVSAVIALPPIFTMLSVTLVAWLVPGLIPPDPITFWSAIGGVLVVLGSLGIALGTRKSRR